MQKSGAKTTATSRGGNRSRQPDPDAPLAVYCRLTREKLEATQDQIAERIGKTKALVSQYETGRTWPPGDVLIELSMLSGLSLGIISALAVARDPARATAGHVGDIEARFAMIPPMLREGVLAALNSAEVMATSLPHQGLWQPVPDAALERLRAPRAEGLKKDET